MLNLSDIDFFEDFIARNLPCAQAERTEEEYLDAVKVKTSGGADLGKVHFTKSGQYSGVWEFNLVEHAEDIKEIIRTRGRFGPGRLAIDLAAIDRGSYAASVARSVDWIVYLDGSVKDPRSLSLRTIKQEESDDDGRVMSKMRTTARNGGGVGYGFIVFALRDGDFVPHYYEYGPVDAVTFPNAAPYLRISGGYDRDVNYLSGGSTGAELPAFIKVCEYLGSVPNIDYKKVLICYDNKFAPCQIKGLYASPKRRVQSLSAAQFQSDLSAGGFMPIASDFRWIWTKSHEGEFGNECANHLAEMGADSLRIGGSRVVRVCRGAWPVGLSGWKFSIMNSDYFEVSQPGTPWAQTSQIQPFFSPIAPSIRNLEGRFVSSTASVGNVWNDWLDAL